MSNADQKTPVIELDARGLVCPSSLLMALRELNSHKEALRSGELALVILTDNPDSTNRIAETAVNMGYQLDTSNIGRGYKITVTKKLPLQGNML